MKFSTHSIVEAAAVIYSFQEKKKLAALGLHCGVQARLLERTGLVVASGVLVPWPGFEPRSLSLEGGF